MLAARACARCLSRVVAHAGWARAERATVGRIVWTDPESPCEGVFAWMGRDWRMMDYRDALELPRDAAGLLQGTKAWQTGEARAAVAMAILKGGATFEEMSRSE